MKLTLLYFLVITACFTGYSQQRRNYSFKNATLPEALEIIRKTDRTYELVYAEAELAKCLPVTLNRHHLTQLQVIDLIMTGQPVGYKVNKRDSILSIYSHDIRGWIYDLQQQPVDGATILLDGGVRQVTTGADGYFRMKRAAHHDSFTVSHINKLPQVVHIGQRTFFTVTLTDKIAAYADVQVVPTGYEFQSRERASGVFDLIPGTILENRPCQHLGGKLDNLSAGLLIQYGANRQPIISLRGQSTFHASSAPLVVVDNFPHEGNLALLNPEDVASITVLKDAAATSIWGARAGNGVIVITTKGSKKRKRPKTTVRMAYGWSPRPAAFYERRMAAADYVQVEQYLFKEGHYNQPVPAYVLRSPAILLLQGWKAGKLDSLQATSGLLQLGLHEVRNDIKEYYYHRGIWQQLHASIEDDQAYFSVGVDRNLSGFTGGQQTRFSVLANTRVKLGKKLVLHPVISITQQTTLNDKAMPEDFYPYTRLADAQGRPLTVARDLDQNYKAAHTAGNMPDWSYRPLEELALRNKESKTLQARVQVGLSYPLLKGLNLKAIYQLQWEDTKEQDLHSMQTYYYRNLANSFTYRQGDRLITPILPGSINDEQRSLLQVQFLRAQADLEYQLGPKWRLTALAGAETWKVIADTNTKRIYNYGDNIIQPIDYTKNYALYFEPGLSVRIPHNDYAINWQHYNNSFFSNAALSFEDRYTLTVSGRMDQSNLVGVATNNNRVPLWSAGFKWDISQASFFPQALFQYLALRASMGYSGNIDKTAVGWLTFTRGYTNRYGQTAGIILNPPNPELRWEKSLMFNLGTDFTLVKHRLTGSVEVYWRRGRGLVGMVEPDLTSGMQQVKANSAAMNGRGWDLTLKSQLRLGAVHWQINTVAGFTTNTVVHAEKERTKAWDYVDPAGPHLRAGYPATALFSFAWRGLDGRGNPQGYLNGQKSADYMAILDAAPHTLVYEGSITPRYFGSMQHSFRYKGWEWSLMVSGKFDYVFRRPSIRYHDLFTGIGWGDPDYARRWQQQGDEQHTQVPSLVYPAHPLRDQFYTFSEVLVEKGDHIRLREIRVSKELPGKLLPKPMTGCSIYTYISNPCFLYRANRLGIDPDALSFIPAPLSITVGAKLQF